MIGILQRLITYPLAIVIFLGVDFIVDSNTEVIDTVYPLKNHSFKIIESIHKYEKMFPSIHFIYNKRSFDKAFDDIGIYNLTFTISDHLAFHSIQRMLNYPEDINYAGTAYTYVGNNCYVVINPMRMGVMDTKLGSGIFNIDFVLLHEAGHCKLNRSSIDLLGYPRESSEFLADVFAINKIINMGLGVDVNNIIRDRSTSDFPDDEHLDGDMLRERFKEYLKSNH